MEDKYPDFATLARFQREGLDFRILLRRAHSGACVLAPHGGAIELGTSEIADAIAGKSCSFYAFEGLKLQRNMDLHITSTRFDEPLCMALLRHSDTVLAIHGEHSHERWIAVGGLNTELGGRIAKALRAAGFDTRTHSHPGLRGLEPTNICNRGRSGAGVQIEISQGVRASLFATLSPHGCTRPTGKLCALAEAIQGIIA